MEPSMTRTKGASSSSSTAWRNGFRNSSPPSVGDRTLLCRCTFGRPGIAPSSTSSMLGSDAAVIDTESPSQLMPSEIQRMWTSSTPFASAVLTSASASYEFVFLELQRVHEQLVTTGDLDLQRTARRARRGERGQRRLGAARLAAHRRGYLLHHKLGALDRRALRYELEREVERVGHDLAQVADPQLDARHPSPSRMPARDLDHCVRDRELVHQQILGRGSPTSWSITRLPPKDVSTRTMLGGSVRTSPISAACSQPGTARIAASASSATSGATNATSFPSLATYMGSMPRISAAPATAWSTGTAASRTIMATPDARASSFSTDATPPRVASRMQRSALPAAASSASATGHSERVSDWTLASRSNSPRASMIAVPCSPMDPETRMRSPGIRALGASRARESTCPMPVVQMYISSAWPRSTTFVSPPTISTPAAAAASAIAWTSARSVSAGKPSSRISDRV